MNEVLTRAEMEARFNGEWVLIADPEMDKNRDIQRGRDVFHGKDRKRIAIHPLRPMAHLKSAKEF